MPVTESMPSAKRRRNTPGKFATWVLIVLISLGAGLAGGILMRDLREQERLDLLRLETRRLGIELMAQTLNGSLMGATELLGRVDEDIKREVRDELAPNGANVTRLLRAVMRSGDSDGGFIVGRDGIIRSSFGLGKSSTGVNVQFRPYFKAAMSGKPNVYAAIGTTTGRRTLYYAAPAYQGEESGTPVIGLVVARGGIAPVDKLLAARSDIALLLSPQGVVFAANRPDWIGFLSEKPAPERLKEIRDLKQFGALFDSKEPSVLPVSTQPGRAVSAGGRFAVAPEPVNWNDPLGNWQVVLMEDLAVTVAARQSFMLGAGFALTVLGLLSVLLVVTRSRQTQRSVADQLAAFAERQKRAAEYKSQLAAAALKLQQAHGASAIAQTFLEQAHDMLDAFQGVVYVLAGDDSKRMILAASYACADAAKPELQPGAGLLGECALTGHAQVIETPPGGIWSIQSGLGHTQPAALLMSPLAVQDSVLGVVEIAVLKLPDEEVRQLFGEMVELLALNLKLASRQPSAGESS